VIWVKFFRETGRCAAKPRGGSTSPLEKHADFLLALIELEPDLTLDGSPRCRRHSPAAASSPVIQTTEQYRQHGDECRAMARLSRSPEERGILLKIAETWDELAAHRAAQIARQE
jgi:hypothetical protein